MRLVFAVATRYPHMGGQSTHIADLTRGFARQGHDVAHVSLKDLGDGFVKWAIFRPGYALDKLSMGLRLRWTHPRIEAGLASRLRRLARKGPPIDAVLAQDPMAWHAARRAFGDDRPPIVLTVHGYLVQEHLADATLVPGTTERWLWEKERSAYAGASAIVTVDTRIRDHVVAHGADASKVAVLKNFVDVQTFSPDGPAHEGWPGKRVVLCVRRLVRKNGVRFAALAGRHLGDDHVVVIAGDGPERAAIEADMPDNAQILGPVEHAALPALYRRADVVVVPSVHEKGVEEATSIAALEAMACGRPVVVSAVGGLRELVRDGENGLVVPERSPDAIAAAARRLCDEPEMARRLGQAAREDVLANYSVDARTLDYLRVVEGAA